MFLLIGMGCLFCGCYDLCYDCVLCFGEDGNYQFIENFEFEEGLIVDEFGMDMMSKFRDDVDMVCGLCLEFDFEIYFLGNQMLVFFGSVLQNFGVQDLLDGIGVMVLVLRFQLVVECDVELIEEQVMGFVFKIQVNMDLKYCDCVVFVCFCFGNFECGMKFKYMCSGKMMNIYNLLFFLVQDCEFVQKVWFGDILGIFNYGQLCIGDMFFEKEDLYFIGVLSFVFELLCVVCFDDLMCVKYLQCVFFQFVEEGVVQVFWVWFGGQFVVGVVGSLQFDVFVDCICIEYEVEVLYILMLVILVCWVEVDDLKMFKKFFDDNEVKMVIDYDDLLVFFVNSVYYFQCVEEDWLDICFLKMCEQVY